MTLLVPFDGSPLAEMALVRATKFGVVFDEDVVAVSVLPDGNTNYAREHGWLGPEESFDLKTILLRLDEQVTDLCPDADFRFRVVDRSATAGTIAHRVREVTKEEAASMVFIGSENAGRMVTTVSSVGSTIAAEEDFDVVIVRNRDPAEISKLKDTAPDRERLNLRASE